MNNILKAVSGKKGESQSHGHGTTGAGHHSGGADDRDYLDKGEITKTTIANQLQLPFIFSCLLLLTFLEIGLDSVQRKYGGGKIDPDKNRQTNEKITDGARNMFEKATG